MKYALQLIVVVVVSSYSTTVKELHGVVLKVTQVGSKISLNRKRPSNDIYAAEDLALEQKSSFIRKGLN